MLRPFDELRLPISLARELRSDHAGETGAVWIYHGILAVSRNAEVREFAQTHLTTEQAHLNFFETWLPKRWHTRLTPLWKLAGWLLGALPAFFGPRAVFLTIRAVETFVDHHYAEQITTLSCNPHWQPLAAQLQTFRDEECEHRDDAASRLDRSQPGPIARLWTQIVSTGSAAGVYAARRI